MDKDDKDLLPPSVDPNKKAIGIRKVTAINEASTRSVMTVRGHIVITDEKGSDTGPTPLEFTLSSLIGCEGVIINRCVEAMSFTYSRVEIEAEGEVDQRGSRGVHGARPYFNWVSLRIRITTPETPWSSAIATFQRRRPRARSSDSGTSPVEVAGTVGWWVLVRGVMAGSGPSRWPQG